MLRRLLKIRRDLPLLLMLRNYLLKALAGESTIIINADLKFSDNFVVNNAAFIVNSRFDFKDRKSSSEGGIFGGNTDRPGDGGGRGHDKPGGQG